MNRKCTTARQLEDARKAIESLENRTGEEKSEMLRDLMIQNGGPFGLCNMMWREMGILNAE